MTPLALRDHAKEILQAIATEIRFDHAGGPPA